MIRTATAEGAICWLLPVASRACSSMGAFCSARKSYIEIIVHAALVESIAAKHIQPSGNGFQNHHHHHKLIVAGKRLAAMRQA